MKPPKKHVGIWIRVSTEAQAQGERPEYHQKRADYYLRLISVGKKVPKIGRFSWPDSIISAG